MSDLRVTRLRGRTAGSAPSLPDGVVISGISTITDSTQSTSTSTGALIVHGGVGIAKSLTVGGNVSVAGTLTYEDVTNVDSVGLITAKSGIKVGNPSSPGIGVTIDPNGNAVFAGILTATTFSGIEADKIFEGNTEVETIDTGSDGHVKMTTEGSERVRVGPAGQIGLGGANYGTSGQVITSAGSGSAPSWAAIPAGGNQVDLVSDGTIAAGKPCIIKTDGKVQQVGVVFSNPGSAPQNSTELNRTDQSYYGVCWSPQRNRLIIAQSKESGNKQASAAIATPALPFGTNSLVAGSDQPFDTSDVEWTDCAYDPDTNQAIFVWEDMGSSNYGKCVLGTLSGNDFDEMTFGTTVTFESSAVDSCKVVYDTTNDKAVVIYRITSSGAFKAIVGTVSGTDISFGTAVDLTGGYITDPGGIDACFAAGSINRVVAAFHHAGDGNKGNTVALQVSGTSITWGTPVQHNGNGAASHNRCCYEENAGKVVVSFRDDTNSGIGGVNIATITGSTVTFAGSVTPFPGSIQCGGQGLCYDPSSKDIFIFCAMSNSSNHGRIIRGTVSGNSITIPYATTLTGGQDAMYSDNKNWDLIPVNTGNTVGDGAICKIVGICRQQNNTNMKIYTFKTQTSTTNGTCNNIIGWSDAAYTDGQTATLKTVGNVIDNQSGLTPGTDYFIQGDGTLGTAWDSSSFGSCATNANFGGTAIAADKLLIRDINAKF